MSEITIFNYEDYKLYLLDFIEVSPNQGRGQKRRMAEFIGCQPSYVSHVLTGNKHFSIEQGEAITRYIGHRNSEKEYFLSILEYSKAGTKELKSYLKTKLATLKESHQKITNRVQSHSEISQEDQLVYYSSWHYQAIRMALSIPRYRTAPALAKIFNMAINQVFEVLDFLMLKGMVVKKNNEYFSTNLNIHLDSDSPFISKLHSNWRIHTLSYLNRKKTEDFHYSAVVSLSHKDFDLVREVYMNALLESHKIIKPSESEKLCVMGMDFYEV